MFGVNSTGDRHWSRRSFLQAGVLGVGGLTLADFSQLRGAGAVRSRAAGTSVILFWLSGGPGHMETWDPSPTPPPSSAARSGRSAPTCPASSSASCCPSRPSSMDKLAILADRQPRLRRPHQGQPLDAHRLRRARPSTPPTSRVQRRPSHRARPSREAARPEPAGHAALRRRAAPARRHRQLLPLRRLPRRRRQPVHRRVRPERRRSSASGTSRCPAT